MKFGQVININSENLGKNYPFEKIKYVDISSVGEGFISDLEEIKVENAPSRAKRIVRSDNTIISTVRPQNRSFFYFKDTPENIIASTGFAVLSPKEDLIDGRYLFYIISDKNFTAYLANHEKGAAYPAITTDVIFNREINLPPLQTQKRIASILSAYDDLIENNLKRIKLLEETAQNIYKEWFVNFRFPNYENTPINQETGLPEGWGIKPLNEYVDFKEGPGLRNWQFKDGGIPFLNIRMMGEGELDFTSVKYLDESEVESKYSHFLLSEFDHVISTSGTLGKVVTIRKSHLPLCLNTSIIRMRPIRSEIGKWQLRELIKSPEFLNLMKSFATGSAQLNFGPKHLNMLTLNVPSVEIGESFERLLNPIEVQICELLEFNQKLKEARDILLPRLMNRTIEV